MKLAALNEDFEQALDLKQQLKSINLATQQDLLSTEQPPKTSRDLVLELLENKQLCEHVLAKEPSDPELSYYCAVARCIKKKGYRNVWADFDMIKMGLTAKVDVVKKGY